MVDIMTRSLLVAAMALLPCTAFALDNADWMELNKLLQPSPGERQRQEELADLQKRLSILRDQSKREREGVLEGLRSRQQEARQEQQQSQQELTWKLQQGRDAREQRLKRLQQELVRQQQFHLFP
jgi:hypothetical protein